MPVWTPGIAPGLAGTVQGGQGGPRDRPRRSRGCAGDPPYGGRPERAGICAYERILFIRAGRWARKLPEFRYFCWKSLLKMVLAKFSCFKMCESIQISIQNGPPQMTAGKGPPFWRHLLGESAKLDPRIAPGLAGAVQERRPIGAGPNEPGFSSSSLKIQEFRSFCWKSLLKTISGKF